METFKGRPRLLSYPSPPDRELIANLKKPSKDVIFFGNKEFIPTVPPQQFNSKEAPSSAPSHGR